MLDESWWEAPKWETHTIGFLVSRWYTNSMYFHETNTNMLRVAALERRYLANGPDAVWGGVVETFEPLDERVPRVHKIHACDKHRRERKRGKSHGQRLNAYQIRLKTNK